MPRITELKLPLDHDAAALEAAVRSALVLPPDATLSFTIARRGYDARRRSAIQLVYTIDARVPDEGECLRRCADNPRIGPIPDQTYRFIVDAPNRAAPRPVVIGCGPCGLLAALTLAQMGFRPLILERGRIVRERTKDTWGLWRRGVLKPESNVQFGEGGAGTQIWQSTVASNLANTPGETSTQWQLYFGHRPHFFF